MVTELVLYDQARHALAAAHRIDEVKTIRDKAEAMAAYARQAKDSQLIQYATEIKVRAERRCGELTREIDKSPGGQPKNSPHRRESSSKAKTLQSMGITTQEASRYEQLAAMPAKHFETAVATAKETVGQITTAFMLREAKSIAQPHGPAKPARTSLRVDTTAPYEPTTPRKQAIAEGQKERLEEALSMMGGCAHGLKSLDLGMLRAVLTATELHAWAFKAREIARTLRTLARQLHRGQS
jgi:hypothetical protein